MGNKDFKLPEGWLTEKELSGYYGVESIFDSDFDLPGKIGDEVDCASVINPSELEQMKSEVNRYNRNAALLKAPKLSIEEYYGASILDGDFPQKPSILTKNRSKIINLIHDCENLFENCMVAYHLSCDENVDAQTELDEGTEIPQIPSMIYYLVIGGKRQGPMDFAAVESKIVSGEANENTLLWKKGMNEWAKISTVANFTHLFDGECPPPLPM